MQGQTIAGRFQIVERICTDSYFYRGVDSQTQQEITLTKAPDGISTAVAKSTGQHLLSLDRGQHPLVIKPSLVFEDERGGVWIVSPYCIKGSEATTLIMGSPLAALSAFKITLSLANELAKYIQKGGTANGIRTSDIFISTADDQLEAIFGLYEREWLSQLNDLTSQTAIGSDEVEELTYSTPDQLLELDSSNDQVAMYRTGLILYHLLHGAPPFVGDLHDLMQHHVSSSPPALTKVKGLDDVHLQTVNLLISRMLDKSPGERLTWIELFTDLSSLIKTLESEMQERSERVINDRYELVEEIGRGGFGVVHRAVDLNIARREVAVKQLTINALEHKNVVTLFEREAKILSRLRHPNTLTLLDYGLNPSGQPFMVSELLQGAPLNEYIKGFTDKKLQPMTAIQIISAVTEALGEAHELKVVHRDIKPENIFISEGQINRRKLGVKLLDFGISKIRAEAQETLGDDAKTNGFMGTLEYMSPEQFKDTAQVDHRTDFYSLGIVLYELVAGSRPFKGDSLYMIVTQHNDELVPAVDFAHLSNEMSAEINDLIAWMTAKDREHRPNSAHELLDRLQEIEDALKITNSSSLKITGSHLRKTLSQTQSAKRQKPKGKGVIWGAAAIIMLCVGGWFIWKNQTKKDQLLSVSQAHQNSTNSLDRNNKEQITTNGSVSKIVNNASNLPEHRTKSLSKPSDTDTSIVQSKQHPQTKTINSAIPAKSTKPTHPPKPPKPKTVPTLKVSLSKVNRGFSFEPGSRVRFSPKVIGGDGSRVRYYVKPSSAGRFKGDYLHLNAQAAGRVRVKACIKRTCSSYISLKVNAREDAPPE